MTSAGLQVLASDPPSKLIEGSTIDRRKRMVSLNVALAQFFELAGVFMATSLECAGLEKLVKKDSNSGLGTAFRTATGLNLGIVCFS